MKTTILTDISTRLKPCVATIGFFDGVHKGHRFLIRQVLDMASERGLGSAVITFDQHPRQVLDCNFRPLMLSTHAEKTALLAATGIDECVVLPFNKEMAAMEARDFMQKVLAERLNVRVLVTGYDNRFGHNRTEGFSDYVAYGREIGMEVVQAEALRLDGVGVSSSVIRTLLGEGEVEMGTQCLGYPYMLTGTVVKGEQVGRSIGFPTANLLPDDNCKLIPAPGAYAVRVALPDRQGQLAGMMNIGSRPTFDGQKTTLEVNIFNFDGDIYGCRMGVSFVSRLRAERKFRNGGELAAQLKRDAEEAMARLGQHG